MAEAFNYGFLKTKKSTQRGVLGKSKLAIKESLSCSRFLTHNRSIFHIQLLRNFSLEFSRMISPFEKIGTNH